MGLLNFELEDIAEVLELYESANSLIVTDKDRREFVIYGYSHIDGIETKLKENGLSYRVVGCLCD